VGFFPIGWDPRVPLILAGLASPLVDDGKGLILWRNEIKSIFVDNCVLEKFTCSILKKKFALMFFI